MGAPGDRLTRPGQVQYGDLLLGRGTSYRWATLTGWEELPALDSGTVLRAGDHGGIPGLLLAQTRTVGLDGLVVRAKAPAIGSTVAAFAAGTVPVADELPLAVWLDERGPLLTWARCLRRALPVGKYYTSGTLVGGAIEWEATDPRRYALDEQTVTAHLPAPEPGLDWHVGAPERLDWPLVFGASSFSGGASAWNAGTADTHPTVTFRGPVDRPALTNIATGAALEYDITLAATDTLTVDTAAGTVLLNGTASRIYTATDRSVPEQTFVLCPGTTDLTFRAAPGSTDPAASATITWRSAYW